MPRQHLKAFEVPAIYLVNPKPKYRARKIITVPVTEEDGKKTWWTRSELKSLLSRNSRKPMPESTFKCRLELLEFCPEVDRRLYGRRFSDLAKWSLIEIEKLHKQFDFNAQKVTEYLENIGLDTSEYFRKHSRNRK